LSSRTIDANQHLHPLIQDQPLAPLSGSSFSACPAANQRADGRAFAAAQNRAEDAACQRSNA